MRPLIRAALIVGSLVVIKAEAASGGAYWDHDANAANAVQDFQAAYKAGGIGQATQTMQECYAGLEATPDLQRTEYCVAFDLVEGSIEHALNQQKGWPVDDEFETGTQTTRVMTALGAAGVATDAQRPTVDDINTALMAAAQAKPAQAKPPVDEKANAEASAAAWLANLKVFPADAQPQPYASSSDRDNEDACFLPWNSTAQLTVALGGVVSFDTSNPFKNIQRQCVYIALCDLLDGKPNLMSRVSLRSLHDAPSECSGVELYAPEFIAGEPKTFEDILDRLRRRTNAAAMSGQ